MARYEVVVEFEAAAEDLGEAGSEVGADRPDGAACVDEAVEPPHPATTMASARMHVHFSPALTHELAPAICPVASTVCLLAWSSRWGRTLRRASVKSLRNSSGFRERITFDSQTSHRRRGDDVAMTATQDQIRLLVVDDEPHIVDLVATALRYQGFAVLEARRGVDAIRAVETDDPALIVLDVMLPDIDGFEIVRRLRAAGRRTPVLYLTARDATEDRVRGLNAGGDDFLVKPFGLSELVARVNAILRRTLPARESRVLSYADLRLDEDLHEVRRGDRVVDLTPTEYELLRYLLANPRQALSKSQILDHVWDYDFDGQSGVVDTYVSYLRKKLDPLGPPLIRTIRGVGYALREPAE